MPRLPFHLPSPLVAIAIPPGRDKGLEISPAGSIGLPAEGAVVLLRLDESEDLPTKDAAGNLFDLVGMPDLPMPNVVPAALGFGREFASSGFVSTDIVPGSTLLTRDLTVQVVFAPEFDNPMVGTIVARGTGVSSAEYMSYALEINVIDGASEVCEIRWLWHDTAGVLKVQTGAQFAVPFNRFGATGIFALLTATRRWVSPTSVLLRYYIGDVLLGEVESSDGSIGGGTTGTFCVGARFSDDEFDNFLFGTMDELLIVGREMTREEIEATWLRLSLYQPLGQQLFESMHDRGFPLPNQPESDVQLETRLMGHALGYAGAQIENFRANALPGRSYGQVLQDWETATQPTPDRSHDLADIDTRRARVLARLRQHAGCSIPGIEDALSGLIDADLSSLSFLAFDNTEIDNFATINPLRWDVTPSASWTAPAGTARSALAAGSYVFDGTSAAWRYVQMSVGDYRQVHALSKVAMTTPQDGLEVGVFFAERAHNNFLLLGLRDVAGSFKVVTESFINYASQGVVIQATLGANPAALWLHLCQTVTDGTWQAAWSTTSATTGYTTGAGITHPTAAYWSGIYVRSTAAIAGSAQVDVDDFTLRCPFGTRPLNAYVLIDPAAILDGSNPDEPGCYSVLQAIRHAFVNTAFIFDPVLRCDDPSGGCDRGPLGGI